jgi:hypothetical protein
LCGKWLLANHWWEDKTHPDPAVESVSFTFWGERGSSFSLRILSS